jgi:hypothetical protein
MKVLLRETDSEKYYAGDSTWVASSSQAMDFHRAADAIRPVPSERLQIAAQFFARARPEFRPWNERKTVPSLWIWQDRLQTWWDWREDHAFRKRFKEDNLPKPRPKRSPFPKDW